MNGELFIKNWYRLIDGKADVAELEAKCHRERLVVDFPKNRMNFEEFCEWYRGQCRDYNGCHELHTIKVTENEREIVIESEITWRAKTVAGNQDVTMWPNVTIKLDWDPGSDEYRVFYYGCVPRYPK